MVDEYSHTHTTACLPSYGVAGTTSGLVHSLKETILCNQALTMLLCNSNFLYLANSLITGMNCHSSPAGILIWCLQFCEHVQA